jgi:hypothetical protein
MEHEATYVCDRCKEEKPFSEIAEMSMPEDICNPFMAMTCVCWDCLVGNLGEDVSDGENEG